VPAPRVPIERPEPGHDLGPEGVQMEIAAQRPTEHVARMTYLAPFCGGDHHRVKLLLVKLDAEPRRRIDPGPTPLDL